MAATGPSLVQPFDVWWPALADATHAIISGGKGSGKTTLVRAVMLDLARQGMRFVIIDPHYKKGEWGPGITPLAKGRRFEEARIAFAWGNQELDRRYKLRADDGIEEFEPIAFVVDEFDLFTDKRPDVSEALRELASRFLSMIGDESRKVGIRLIVIAHGTEVKNLGLEGRGNKRLNYTIVQLRQGPHQQPEPTGTLRIGSTTWTIDTTPVLDLAAGQLQPEMLVPLPDVATADDLSTDPIVLQRRIRVLEEQLDAPAIAPAEVQLGRLETAIQQLVGVQRDLKDTVQLVRKLLERTGRPAKAVNSAAAPSRPTAKLERSTSKLGKRTAPAKPASRRPRASARSTDAIADTLALPAVAAKVTQAQRLVDPRAAAYIPRVLRLCWSGTLSPQDIAEGQGTPSTATCSRIRSACTALVKVGLLAESGMGRLQVNHGEIDRLRTLARAVEQGS